MSSCKKRIAPWIVKHLKPMNDELIENRFLFKKVAKHIAEKVILQDQYPGEYKRGKLPKSSRAKTLSKHEIKIPLNRVKHI